MAQVDINHPPAGGFQNGGWYWDPKVGQARQYYNGAFGAANTIANPNQQGYGQPVHQTIQGNSNPGSSIAPIQTTNSQNPLQQINDAISGSFQKLQDQATKAFKDYTSSNPFSYDQVLADKTKSATEQIDPYYHQLLGDYMDGVQRKLDRGFNDTQDLLSELSASKASYTTAATNNENNALEQSNQQFANAGLTDSGASLRGEGQIKQNTNANLNDYTRQNAYQVNQANQNLARNIQDTHAGSSQYQTQLGQQKYTDIQNRAADLTKEAGQQYVQGFQATLPTQLQSASGFDMLKSLGIYS